MALKRDAITHLANRLMEIHQLNLPFQLIPIAQQYASVHILPIPIEGVNGISLNIKSIHKKPVFLINSALPKTKQLFMLAHQLGHLIIPWHIGSFIDETATRTHRSSTYAILEKEANQFAAAILMPPAWVLQQYELLHHHLSLLHQQIVKAAHVSDFAAAIQMIQLLPAHILYTLENDDRVAHSNATNGTLVAVQKAGEVFQPNQYPFVHHYSSYHTANGIYHWFQLLPAIALTGQSSRSWRMILDGMVDDIQPPAGDIYFKQMINGTIAQVNSRVKLSNDYSVNGLITALRFQLHQPGLQAFTAHPDYHLFLQKKAEDLFNKKKT